MGINNIYITDEKKVNDNKKKIIMVSLDHFCFLFILSDMSCLHLCDYHTRIAN